MTGIYGGGVYFLFLEAYPMEKPISNVVQYSLQKYFYFAPDKNWMEGYIGSCGVARPLTYSPYGVGSWIKALLI